MHAVLFSSRFANFAARDLCNARACTARSVRSPVHRSPVHAWRPQAWSERARQTQSQLAKLKLLCITTIIISHSLTFAPDLSFPSSSYPFSSSASSPRSLIQVDYKKQMQHWLRSSLNRWQGYVRHAFIFRLLLLGLLVSSQEEATAEPHNGFAASTRLLASSHEYRSRQGQPVSKV